MLIRVSLTKQRTSTRNGIWPDPAVRCDKVHLASVPLSQIPLGHLVLAHGWLTTVLEDVTAELDADRPFRTLPGFSVNYL